MKKTFRFGLWLFGSMLILAGCEKDATEEAKPKKYSADVPISYFNLAIKLTKETPGFTPPVAARAYGYTGVTLYQAVYGGMKNYQTLEGQVNGLKVGDIPAIEKNKKYNWEIVANSALARVMKELYRKATPENLQAIADLEKRHFDNLSTDEKADIVERSTAHGEAVAAAMLEYSKSDGQDECYAANFPADYVPPVGNGFWVPTPPAFSKAMQPYWGNVRPFITADVDGAQLTGHPVFSGEANSPFFAEAAEVYTVTSHLSPEQETIAKYWSDDPGKTGTPPGHSISVLTQVLELESADLAIAIEAYAKVGIAVHDAFVSCWKAKYGFNLMRPVTYIQQYIQPNWVSLLGTPPFPEYPSGHSVQSGAAFQVMTDLFGSNYAMTDRTHEARTDIDGSPRNFSSFHEMAEEAAISRLYGGIHFRAAIDDGIAQGKKIGLNIGTLQFKK